MAYEETSVAAAKSQDGIRKLIMGRKGSKIAFISEPPREGFQAVVMIEDDPYQIRVFGECKTAPSKKTARLAAKFQEQEERRIWRVLYYHLKAVFEAADSGVMEFREIMLPYIVTKSGMTVAESIMPNLKEAIQSNPARMLN